MEDPMAVRNQAASRGEADALRGACDGNVQGPCCHEAVAEDGNDVTIVGGLSHSSASTAVQPAHKKERRKDFLLKSSGKIQGIIIHGHLLPDEASLCCK